MIPVKHNTHSLKKAVSSPIPRGKRRPLNPLREIVSGKRLVVHPGQSFTASERGVYTVLVWRGKGRFGGLDVEGLNFGQDELLVSHAAAVQPVKVENTGSQDLIIFKFFK